MRRSTIFAILLVGSLISLLAPGCDKLTTEINNITLFDTTLGADCLRCHTDSDDSKIIIPRGQWANSAHASTRLLEATVDLNGQFFNTAVCGPVCHSGNGFVKFVQSATTDVNTIPSVINCFTCHEAHTGDYGTWDLKNLRGNDNVGITLATGDIYNYGKSNQCAICHQAINETFDESVTITADWGPHNSPQADILIGTAGFFMDGITVANSHTQTALEDGCLNCHFGEGIGYSFGEHTFRLEDKSTGEQFVSNCNIANCHSGAPSEITDFYADSLLDTLKVYADSIQFLLTTAGVLNAGDTLGFSFTADITVPEYTAKILYNYLLYRLDGSRGIHNQKYLDTLLKISVIKWDTIPTVDFVISIGDPDSCAPLGVQFVSTLSNVDSLIWDFGDGSDIVSAINPAHTFDLRGLYSVTLTGFGPGGSATITKDIFAKGTIAGFSFTPSDSIACDSLTVNFTDLSVDSIDSWEWDFGDGSPISNTQNPTHFYASPGSYIATLIVSGPCGIDTTEATIEVFTSPAADFTADITTGSAPLVVNFTPVSAGVGNYQWDFFDSTGAKIDSSSIEMPTITFSDQGQYTVSLTVTNSAKCSATATKQDFIIVTL